MSHDLQLNQPTPDLILQRDGALLSVTLNRPASLNALSMALQQQLIHVLQAADDHADINALVIRGEGRAFCAGFDRGDMARIAMSGEAGVRDAFTLGESMVKAILDARVSVIAAVHGHCVGGGLSIALAADVVIASRDTMFLIPELDLNMPYLWRSTPLLVASLGLHRARALILTGARFDAAEARDMGLVFRVAEPDALRDDAATLAASIAAKPRRALAAQKKLTRAMAYQLMSATDDEVELGLRTLFPA